MVSVPDHDPDDVPDQQQPGGLVETGPADVPGVQDPGPADADAEDEGAQPLSGSRTAVGDVDA